jgi:hypothetical protein
MYEVFDLKVCKLANDPLRWDKSDIGHLARQLLENQGSARYSVENRVIVIFDGANSSKVDFFKKYESLIVDRVVAFVENPYDRCVWLNDYKCWQGIVIIPPTDFENTPVYYEHSIGVGMREYSKALFHQKLLNAIEKRSNGKMRVNLNHKEHGNDGILDIDRSKIKLVG